MFVLENGSALIKQYPNLSIQVTAFTPVDCHYSHLLSN